MENFKNNTGVNLNEIYNVLSLNKLGLKEKGLYSYLLSKGNCWIFSAEKIALDNKDSLGSIKKSLILLEKEGLLIRTKLRNEKGVFIGMNYEVILK